METIHHRYRFHLQEASSNALGAVLVVMFFLWCSKLEEETIHLRLEGKNPSNLSNFLLT